MHNSQSPNHPCMPTGVLYYQGENSVMQLVTAVMASKSGAVCHHHTHTPLLLRTNKTYILDSFSEGMDLQTTASTEEEQTAAHFTWYLIIIPHAHGRSLPFRAFNFRRRAHSRSLCAVQSSLFHGFNFRLTAKINPVKYLIVQIDNFIVRHKI